MAFSLILLFASVWFLPDTDVIRAELTSYLQEKEIQIGDVSAGDARFNDVIEILRRSSLPIQQYLDQCDALVWQELPFAQPITLPQTPLSIYVGSTQTNYLFGTLRHYLAKRSVQARLFDEAKNVLQDLTPENSIDPAGVLITKAIVYHHFSEREAGLAALKHFRDIAEHKNVPRRYSELAKLLQFDWEKKSKEDEIEKITRQMNDVRRRLGQGRTDKDTQEAEQNVLQSLEELIEKIEEQAKQQQGKSGQGNNPQDDARRAGLRAQGEVDRREFSPGDQWGDLSPRDREEVLLRIEREFPSQYRDIIEQYFREMAQ